MADFNSAIWSILIAVTTVVSIVALFWFTWVQAQGKKREHGEQIETMGHTWDGDLAEYNNPLPKWWLNMFYITMVWGIGYLIAYPGLGTFKGMLGWTEQGQYEAEMAKAEATYGPIFDKYKSTDIAKLADDAEALGVGKRLFATYCTQCHGSDAGGARGFPNLTDNDWLYGGTPEAIEQTILNGRQAAMPAWGAIIGAEGTQNVASYVEHLAGREVDQAQVDAGQKVCSTTCVACHGPEGKGNVAMGAPNLTDDIWLYGGSRERIVESIDKGRNGRMPAHKEFLGDAKVHLLSAYVYSFTKGNAPAK